MVQGPQARSVEDFEVSGRLRVEGLGLRVREEPRRYCIIGPNSARVA